MLIINFSILALACYTAAAVPFAKLTHFLILPKKNRTILHQFPWITTNLKQKRYFEPVIRVMVKGEKTNKINVIGYFYGRSSLPWQFLKKIA